MVWLLVENPCPENLRAVEKQLLYQRARVEALRAQQGDALILWGLGVAFHTLSLSRKSGVGVLSVIRGSLPLCQRKCGVYPGRQAVMHYPFYTLVGIIFSCSEASLVLMGAVRPSV